MKYLIIAAAITAADQLTKHYAEKRIKSVGEIKLGKLIFTNVRNSGAAMGLFANKPQLLAAMTTGALVQIFAHYYKLYRAGRFDNTYKLSSACVFGGASGNIIDRTRQGYVTDFIQIGDSPVFNVADVSVMLGTILFIVKRLVDLVKGGLL